MRSKDSTSTEPKKITIFSNLNISTGYSISAKEFKWSPVRMSTALNFFDKKLATNLNATFDPYGLDESQTRVNILNIKNGGGLLRLTSANMNMNFSLNNDTFKKEKNKSDSTKDQKDEDLLDLSEIERLSGGGRDDDLFGRSNDFSNSRINKNKENKTVNEKLYYTKLDWSMKLAYQLTYNNSRGQNDFSNNSLMVSGDVDLTPKWKVGVSSGYDFKGKGVTYTQFVIDRDLKSWKLNFSWVPFGDRASWYFFIGIKSGLLSDLKYDKRREPDRNFK